MCDLMVVQELGNTWPGWRGLGKGGICTPYIDPYLSHGGKQVLEVLHSIFEGKDGLHDLT